MPVGLLADRKLESDWARVGESSRITQIGNCSSADREAGAVEGLAGGGGLSGLRGSTGWFIEWRERQVGISGWSFLGAGTNIEKIITAFI
jgi:hypothetical protein